MKNKSKLVSIVIVNYNGKAFISHCLKSLINQTYHNCEIIVVDNNSGDGSADYISKELPSIKLYPQAENIGFAQGCNIGVSNAAGEYILLINPDTEAEKDLISNLVNHLETNKQYAVVVPKIYTADRLHLEACGNQYNAIGNGWGIGYLEQDTGQYDEPCDVPAATGCCMLFRRSLLKETYLFQKNYFMYFEEIDFSIRVRRLGKKIGFCPSAKVYHQGSQSIPHSLPNRTVFKQSFASVNRLNILIRYYPISILIIYGPLIILSYLYVEYLFLSKAGVRDALLYNWRLINVCHHSIIKRLQGDENSDNRWIEDIRRMRFLDLIRLKKLHDTGLKE